MFFQDLPDEFQHKIFEGLKKDLKNLQLELKYKNTGEFIDNHINCNNTQLQIKEWVNRYCLD